MEDCAFLLSWLPLQWGIQRALWLRLQVFVRSQCFFNARLLVSGSEWPAVALRSRQRNEWDCLALMHDSSDLCLSGYCAMLGQLRQPWAPPWRTAVANCRSACLDGLVEFGHRSWVADEARISPRSG
jgi:hypothetical protein